MAEEKIFDVQRLEYRPGTIYISPTGKTMFIVVGPEEKMKIVTAKIKNFNDMSDEEINQFVKKLIEKSKNN